MSDFTKLKVKKNSKEYVLNACTQDTEQNITGTKNFSKLTVNSRNVVTSINGISPSEDGNIELAAGGSKELGEIFYSTTPMNNVNYHLLDGTILDSNAVEYKQFYNYILGVKSTNSNIFITEEEYQTQLNDKGVCGKYVLDEVNKTIRLPKITGFVEGTVDSSALGELVEAGLPNIEGTFNNTGYDAGANATGAFYISNSSQVFYGHTTTPYYRGALFAINASRSSSIYGNSTTVQPQSIKLFVYVVVNNGSVEDAPLDVTKEYQLNNPFSLFDYRYVSHRLNNASWVLSTNTFLSGDLYPTAYEKLLAELNESSIGLSVKNTTDEYTDYDYVVDTENNTFRLPLVIKERVLVESKVATDEDPTWYNLYSDGWLEQGGLQSIQSGNSPTTVTLLKPYNSTNYSLLCTVSGYEYAMATGNHKTETNFNWSTVDFKGLGYLYSGSWYACGYAQDTPTTNLYFYLGDTVSNPSLIELGFVQDRIGRVERKIGNLSEVCGIPDYDSAINITSYFASSGAKQYTAPCDGVISLISSGAGEVDCFLMSKKQVLVEKNLEYTIAGTDGENGTGGVYNAIIPKGMTVYLAKNYSGMNTTNGRVMFIPFK